MTGTRTQRLIVEITPEEMTHAIRKSIVVPLDLDVWCIDRTANGVWRITLGTEEAFSA